ncbi:MAG: glycoside hydrolase family 92 protein [Bacteroidales bacterium]|mgnify:CR=1 FL=1|jgi:predicted alpha-1,2-mannosidase|nr:glycoside hydrolase family 92 protein [Bacteroidales bacterium]NPV37171.1 glycoside hydrolase family 92 protein [Bacteroidales bacterium]
MRFFSKLTFFVMISLLLGACSQKVETGNDPARWVDPFIGTAGHGHTFPGATLPFGMVQVNPQTRLNGWDGCSGYHYSDSIIYGFAHTALNGTGALDYGDILLMPVVGEPVFINTEYSSPFSKTSEVAEPGYYSVKLDKPEVLAEVTATSRVGYHRYTFPKTENALLILDLQHRDRVLDSWIEFINDHEIRGMRRGSQWASDKVWYFHMEFSRPFTTKGIALNDTLRNELTKANGTNLKAYVGFDTRENDVVEVKVALSAVDAAGALKNLQEELPGWGFDETRKKARETWNKELSKIYVKGGTPRQLKVFYTALYHAMLQPNIFMDVDRRYRGMDRAIDTAVNFTNYTVFSLWDTYRAWHPLMTILDSARTVDYIRTMLNQYQKSGNLPVWELAGNETWCMIGNHAIPVIVDAWLKGIKGFDPQVALQAAINSVNADRVGYPVYRKYGYLPGDKEHESVSKTLEYAFDDWCIAQLAKNLNQEEVYKKYIQASQFYKNLFDPSTGFIRPRISGAWLEPFNPTTVDWNYTEANAWQYNFYVPHDVNTHIRLMGGDSAYAARLDELFSANTEVTGRDMKDISGLIGQYAHGNEPSHHVAYLYNFVGQPWKTQEKVRYIMDHFYTDQPDGIIGNEDCGQMSAWLIMSAMGFYPVNPASGQYIVGTPWFDEMDINLPNGKILRITASHPSEKNFYVQGMEINGQPWNYSYVFHKDLIAGGHIHFKLGKKPSLTWAFASDERPKAEVIDDQLVTSPYFNTTDTRVRKPISVSMATLTPGAEIFYTLDGSLPDNQSLHYKGPIEINQTTHLTAIAWHPSLGYSYPVDVEFVKIDTNRRIQVLSKVHPNYTAGGPEALIDGLRGPENWRLGGWQGYQGNDFEAVVDLGNIMPISYVGAGFIHDIGAWIWAPKKVEFEVSEDARNWKPVLSIDSPVSIDDYTARKLDLGGKINLKARYVKVKAMNLGKIPQWHLGAGGDAYIFIDEIIIK